MIDEYSMLREEIILSMKTVKNYNMFCIQLL